MLILLNGGVRINFLSYFDALYSEVANISFSAPRTNTERRSETVHLDVTRFIVHVYLNVSVDAISSENCPMFRCKYKSCKWHGLVNNFNRPDKM